MASSTLLRARSLVQAALILATVTAWRLSSTRHTRHRTSASRTRPEQARIEERLERRAVRVENEADRERVRAALRACNDPRKVEEDFNRVEVPHLFGHRIGETTDDEDAYLAGVLAKTWTAALREQFPGKTFRVSVWPASDSEAVALGFHQG